LEDGLEGAFGTGGRPGDEADFKAGRFPETQNCRGRVFLRATNNQPGNDVDDPHPVYWDQWLSKDWSLFRTPAYSVVSSGAALK
jgi:hypothetical protein